jgi:hypothetical protein
MGFEGDVEHILSVQFAERPTIVQAIQLALGGDSKASFALSGRHTMSFRVPEQPNFVALPHYEGGDIVEPQVLMLLAGSLIPGTPEWIFVDASQMLVEPK